MLKKIIPVILAISLCSCHRQKTFDTKILEDIREFNRKEAPKQMDSVTSLDSMGFEQDSRTITYFYTLFGAADDESIITEEIIQAQQEALLQNLRSSIQLKPYKEQGVNFEYIYCSRKSGKALMKYSFSAEDYQ